MFAFEVVFGFACAAVFGFVVAVDFETQSRFGQILLPYEGGRQRGVEDSQDFPSPS